MQFSVIFEAQLADPTPQRERETLADCVEQAVAAEAAGFDRIWAVEHHSLLRYAHMSAPDVFLAHVAAKTSRIRLGHGVVCLPFGYGHPIRVAERAAMLDVLSGGRLDLGAGRGATRQEMAMCGVDPASTYEQVEEALRIIGNCWTAEQFQWHGLLDIGPGQVLPRPVQAPHPPLFMACSKAETLRTAADYGVGALVLGFAGAEEISAMRRVYDAALAERTGERFVSAVRNDHFAALCPTIVADDGAEAFRIGARGQRFFAESILHWYGGGPEPSEDTADDDNAAVLKLEREAVVAKLHEANIPVRPSSTGTYNVDHAYGTASRAVEYVGQLARIGVDEVICLIQMGTVPHDAALETIRQWGAHVIPHFRKKDETR
ncbi:LLM class flavin-dependent oxidoreductase [Catenulispora sp. NF23]|uniref:LLM class flavin-dependent oxidoreductase n=1 Tax=Catenulispora pinistramenti TaxID=2705254 RepID=UPI001BAD15F9|nr:LLM class flavin-dependent oxidoreductase [Catenulispora pinistramenti]MBS2534754.1 LLM class flavin-dependent oxidoreductase [Catenulispora pinistramenti]